MDRRPLSAALQARIDRDDLPGVSYTVLHRGEVVAQDCLGWADREARVPLREDHLFRIYSNTKLATSCAVLQLVERGLLGLDDPVGDYIPALRTLQVLRPGATSLADTEPAREPVRIKHLLTHTAGFTYGFLDPSLPIAKAYAAAGIGEAQRTLAQMCEALATLPLLFQPGSAWSYSVSTDVVGHVVEVVSGLPLDAYFRRHLFEPLGMQDTFFFVPEDKAARLVPMYIGDLKEPSKPGLRRGDAKVWDQDFLHPVPRLMAGGGLVSSLADWTKFVHALLDGGSPVLQPETMRYVTQNQLPPGMWIGFPNLPLQTGRGHSYAASVCVEPGDPGSVSGEVQWGGLAGTKWMFSPREQLAVVLMTQRYMSSELPFWPEFKLSLRG